MKATCQYTGIEFDAKSARTKNHPEFAKLMTEAHREGVYERFMTAVKNGKEKKTAPMTIERCRTGLDRIIADEKAKKQRAADFQRETAAKFAAARAARDEQNAHLRAHGYTWHRATQDDVDDGMATDTEWHLLSDDAREVTVDQALDEIKRGREVVLAEIAEREAEAKRQVEIITAAKNEKVKIANTVIETGEKPEGDHRPTGEVLCDTGTIYGTGSWFVVTDTHLWHVQNNGTDGGDWLQNNVTTGGAGGIGYCIERTDAVNQTIERLREISKLLAK